MLRIVILICFVSHKLKNGNASDMGQVKNLEHGTAEI